MPSPFPGIDPYLEDPEQWPDVHHRLIVMLANSLTGPLRPKYRVVIEKRTYQTEIADSLLVGLPDVAILSKQSSNLHQSSTATLTSTDQAVEQVVTVTMPMPITINEAYLEIRGVKTGEVITAIEILSPGNKRPGEGRRAYIRKRRQVLGSLTHLVEIDLLRVGKRMPVIGEIPQTDYHILVSQGNRRPTAKLYPFSVGDQIPVFPLPLRPGDTELKVDLQTIFSNLYDLAGYDLAVDYSQPPVPPLSEEDAVWADALLSEKGRR